MTKTPAEVWKPIPDWPYEVSSLGRVRNARTGRVLQITTDQNGTCHVSLWSDGKQKYFNVAKGVAEAFIGPCPKGMRVRRLREGSNHADNLFYGPRRNGPKTRRSKFYPSQKRYRYHLHKHLMGEDYVSEVMKGLDE